MTIQTYLLILCAAACLYALWRWLKKLHRKRLYSKPFSAQWRGILEDNVRLYSVLPDELKQRLHGHIHFFLHDKKFVPCDGMHIDERVRLTIAANACLLVLNRDRRIFPGFSSILVYPSSYIVQQRMADGDVVYHEQSVRAGESWQRGPVVLSWTDVEHGAANHQDGQNVVLHEFAHKLDEENGLMDGLPVLREASHYAQWASVLTEEYDAFLQRVARRSNRVIDEYGALSATEFFAVICEAFFEKPQQMKKRLPELYGQLAQYFQLDPASWER